MSEASEETAYGPGWSLDRIPEWRADARRATDAFRDRYEYRLGIHYGPDPLQVFDLYRPAGASGAAPTLVFFHPGGFEFGAPSEAGYYGAAILEAGGTYISMGYRLAPEIRFPDSVGDAELGLDFVRSQARDLGVDATRTYASGYSAGAAIASLALFRPDGDGARALAGGVLVSGNYHFEGMREELADRTSRWWVDDLATSIERVPYEVVVISGERDSDSVKSGSDALVASLQGRGGRARHHVEVDTDHFSSIRGLCTPGSPVAETVLAMMGLGGS